MESFLAHQSQYSICNRSLRMCEDVWRATQHISLENVVAKKTHVR